jgi:hypothetical protein
MRRHHPLGHLSFYSRFCAQPLAIFIGLVNENFVTARTPHRESNVRQNQFGDFCDVPFPQHIRVPSSWRRLD